MKANLLEDALSLPIPERIKLADEIYRSVDHDADDSISAEMPAEMERRDADYEANQKFGCTIEELEKQLFKRKFKCSASLLTPESRGTRPQAF